MKYHLLIASTAVLAACGSEPESQSQDMPEMAQTVEEQQQLNEEFWENRRPNQDRSMTVGDLTPRADTDAEKREEREAEISKLMAEGMTRAEAEEAWCAAEAESDDRAPWDELPEFCSTTAE